MAFPRQTPRQSNWSPGPFAGETNASNYVKKVTVGENSALAKFSVISSNEAADFDMLVVTPSGQQLPAATASASETLSVPQPGARRLLRLRQPVREPPQQPGHQGHR